MHILLHTLALNYASLNWI